MTKYVTCFDDYIDDGVPWDWAARWNLAANIYPALVSYSVHPAANSTQPVKRRAMRMETTTFNTGSTAPAPGAVSWDRVGSLADFELLTYCSQPFAGGGNDPCSGGVTYRFRCVGTLPGERQGYYITFRNQYAANGSVHVIFGKTVAGVDTEITRVATAIGAFYFRIKVTGTTIQARAFSDPATEPGTWQINATDATYSVAGWLGWEGWWDSTVETGAVVQRWCEMNFLSLATAGETPQVPLTNTQFQAWLAKPAQRCYLFEATAVGYAAGGGVAGDYTKTAHVYASNMGYVTQAWDYPPSQPYPPLVKKIPTFKRDMGVALSGLASIGFGSVVLADPATTPMSAAAASASGLYGSAYQGARENWLRMKWRKNYAKVWVGDPSWPKHDFRPFLIGRLQQPITGSDNSELEFPINDLSDVLTQDVNPTVYTTGDYVGQRVPCIYGGDRTEKAGGEVMIKTQIEPPRISSVSRIYQLSRRSLGRWYSNTSAAPTNFGFVEVYDNQVALFHTADRTVSASDGTTHTDNGHGMLNGWVYVASVRGNAAGGGFGPTALLMYFVVNSTANTFQLAATPGGAAITFAGFTGGNLSGNLYRGFGYTVDVDNTGFLTQKSAQYEPAVESFNGAILQLVSPAVGRVTVSNVKTYVASNSNTNQGVLFTRVAVDSGMGLGMLDGPGRIPSANDMTNPTKCVMYVGTDKLSAADVFARLSKGLLCYYGFSQDGFFQFGELLLPGTAVLNLTQSDVKLGSLKMMSTKLPWDLPSAQLWLPWFLTGGAFQTGSQQALQGRVAYAVGSFSGSGAPLDSHPQVGDTDKTISQELLFTGAFTYYKTLFAKTIGVFSFQTSMKAFPLKIGDTISLAHPREEWVQFSNANYPQSPDNTASLNGELARVIGIEVNPDASDPYPVTLTVFRQLPGYYPTADVLGNYMTFDWLEEDGVTPVLEEDGVTHVVEEGGYNG